MELFGVTLVGLNSEVGHKVLLTLGLFIAIALLRWLVGTVSDLLLKAQPHPGARFWTWQAISLAAALLGVLGIVSIWFDNPENLTTAGGLVTAGLAFALQKVITSFAGYIVILRGRTFTIGDRIAMGGVRGEVIALGFIQTTILEMGQSPGEQRDAPSLWVKSRQYTGRVVTVTNDRLFEEPVYNYTHEFPFLWEEMTVPISYKDDRRRAEAILLDVAERHTVSIAEAGEQSMQHLRRHYTQVNAETKPRVYMRITDNWVELALRFMVPAQGTRELKDRMSREILEALESAGIGIASATYDIVGFPPIRFAEGSRPLVNQP
jgi:small-conductance mechanosensitive channel